MICDCDEESEKEREWEEGLKDEEISYWVVLLLLCLVI